MNLYDMLPSIKTANLLINKANIMIALSLVQSLKYFINFHSIFFINLFKMSKNT